MPKGLTTHQEWVLEACEGAESCLSLFRSSFPEDARPELAVAMARRWIIGSASEETCQAAYDAANAAAIYARGFIGGGAKEDEDRYRAAFLAARCAVRALGATFDPDRAPRYSLLADLDSFEARALGNKG